MIIPTTTARSGAMMDLTEKSCEPLELYPTLELGIFFTLLSF
jgi:hypothetical protein